MPEPRTPTSAVAQRAPAKVAPTKPTPEGPADGEPPGRLAWFLGWIVVPGSVVGGIFGAGALLGAHRPEGWFARTVMWFVGLF